MKWVQARFAGVCGICSRPVKVGEQVGQSQGRWHHRPCLEALQESQRQVNAINSGVDVRRNPASLPPGRSSVPGTRPMTVGEPLTWGWQHTTRDYDPEVDGDEEAWARAVAEEGWRIWHPSGTWIQLGGRRVRRWALRRPCLTPWSVHDHSERCL